MKTPCPSFARILLAAAAVTALPAAPALAETAYPAWVATHDPLVAGDFTAKAVATDGRGHVYVAGSSSVGGKTLFYVARHDGLSGRRLWFYEHDGGGAANMANDISVYVDPSGNSTDVVATGSVSNAAGNKDFFTVSLSAESKQVLWSKTYAGPAGGADAALKIVHDGAGAAIVTGTSDGAGTGADWFTIKYSRSNGTPLWGGNAQGIRFNNSGGNAADVPVALAVDANDNVAITGSSTRAGGLTSIVAGKMAAANGALIWGGGYRGYDSPQGNAVPVGLALNGAGDAIVTGFGHNANGSRFFHTLSFAATDGMVNWSASHFSAGYETNGPVGVAVDAAGDAIVAGTEAQSDGTRRFYAVKYDGTGGNAGAVVWESRAPSTAGDDFASALAIDAAGDAVLIGRAKTAAGDSDFHTVKLRNADGALAWVQTYRFSENEEDAAAITIGPSGEAFIAGTPRLRHAGDGLLYNRVGLLKMQRLLLETGSRAPGAGDFLSGVPADATVAALRPPAISDSGRIAAVASFKSGTKRVSAIVAQNAVGAPATLALQGRPAPGGSGIYAKFSDPLIDEAGRVAFTAGLSGVPTAERTAVVVQTAAGFVKALVTGRPIASGLTLKSISGMTWRNGFLTALVTVSGPGVNSTNNRALISYRDGQDIFVILRTGDPVTAGGTMSKIRTLFAFGPVPGSPGHGRVASDDHVVVKATLFDKRTVVLTADIDDPAVEVSLYSGQASGLDPGAVWKTFGPPAIDIADTLRVVLGTQAIGLGKVIKADDTALVASEGNDPFTEIARENDPVASLPGLFFDSFRDPVIGAQDQVAWIGTVRGPGVTAKNRACIFRAPTAKGQNTLVARAGSPVFDSAGQIDTALFYKSFVSLGLPNNESNGPVYVARLSGAGVTLKNDTALFSDHRSGFTAGRRLLRTGDSLGDRVISKIAVLSALPGVSGATRSFSHRPDVTAQLTFRDRSTAIVRLSLP